MAQGRSDRSADGADAVARTQKRVVTVDDLGDQSADFLLDSELDFAFRRCGVVERTSAQHHA